MLATLFIVAPVGAVDVLGESCSVGGGAICNDSTTLFGNGGVVSNIINAIVFVVGAVAVIMIVIGGLRYILANGDQSQITSAKNTILYSVIGLIIAVTAGGIVNFVLGRF